jgi:hypothetical protein
LAIPNGCRNRAKDAYSVLTDQSLEAQMAAIKKFQSYVELLRIVIASSISAVLPLTNYFLNYLPTAPGRENLFVTFAVISAGFPIPLVYSSREFFWEWHTNILGLKNQVSKLDMQFLDNTSVEPTTLVSTGELVTEYQNVNNMMKRRYYSGGGIRIQLLSLVLFLLAMGGYGLYLSMLSEYILFLYCTSSGLLSAAFALVALVIFGRPYRRYTLPQFT